MVTIGSCWDAIEACEPFPCEAGKTAYLEVKMAAGCGNGELPAAGECVWVKHWAASSDSPNATCGCFTLLGGTINCTTLGTLVVCTVSSEYNDCPEADGDQCCVDPDA